MSIDHEIKWPRGRNNKALRQAMVAIMFEAFDRGRLHGPAGASIPTLQALYRACSQRAADAYRLSVKNQRGRK